MGLLFLAFFPGFLVALTIHEAAHAIVSKWLGDHYAEKQGRVSLNPMRHLSVLGTLAMFILGFGWGKPVPVNLYNYKHPKLYYLLSSLAGPASNILLCILSVAFMYGLNFVCQSEPGKAEFTRVGQIAYMITWMFLYSLLYINAILAVINLLPIPPLDGSKIWPCLFPGMRASFSGKATWIWIAILIFVMRGDMLRNYIIGPALEYTQKLTPGMLQKQAVLPAGFPSEMRPPADADIIDYSLTEGSDGEPNSFSMVLSIVQPFPAAAYRNQLAKNMAGAGWSRIISSGGADPNAWKVVAKDEDDEDSYQTLTWSGVWEKENNTLLVKASYFSDPNDPEYDPVVFVELKYAIRHPKSEK